MGIYLREHHLRQYIHWYIHIVYKESILVENLVPSNINPKGWMNS